TAIEVDLDLQNILRDLSLLTGRQGLDVQTHIRETLRILRRQEDGEVAVTLCIEPLLSSGEVAPANLGILDRVIRNPRLPIGHQFFSFTWKALRMNTSTLLYVCLHQARHRRRRT